MQFFHLIIPTSNKFPHHVLLISNLISAQVLDKKLDWNELEQTIVVFGIKSCFDNDINLKYPHIYENIDKKNLIIPFGKPGKITQNFFIFIIIN